MGSNTGPISVKIKNNGYVEIYDDRGNYISHLPGNGWVNASVSGDRVVVTNKQGRTEIYDRNGNYIGHN